MFFREGTTPGVWSAAVPFGKGEKGDKGDPGEPGAKGADGADGTDGVDGTNGTDGQNGRDIELKQEAGGIYWRFVGDIAWILLVPIADITGPRGFTGDAGQDGTDGVDGVDGRPVEIQVSGGYIQWRYAGDAAWTNLIALSALKGDQGIQGVQGPDGKNIELQTNATHIQWRKVGDAAWQDLLAKADLKGDTGAAGTTTWAGITGKPTTLGGFGITDALPSASPQMTGLTFINGAMKGRRFTQSGGAVVCSESNFFVTTVAGNITFTFTSVPGDRFGFLFWIAHTGGTIAWPSNVYWSGGVAPQLTVNKTHLFMFITHDAGGAWLGACLPNY